MGARLTSISNFTAFTGLESLGFSDNSISTFSMSGSFPNFTYIQLTRNGLTSIDISNINSLQQLSLSINLLTFIDISNNPDLILLGFQDNNLTVSTVNSMLIQLDNNGLLNGTVDLAGSAAPTGAGITAKNSLIAKGWSVTTN